MKKVAALILTLAMVLCSVAVAETAVAVTGTWYASMYGMVVQLDVNEDGTCVMDIAGFGANTGVWEVEADKLYIDRGTESETVLTIEGETMTASSETETLIFTREPVAVFEAPATVAAADIADFNGTWEGQHISLFGMTLDVATAQAELGEMMNMDTATVVIADGMVSVFGAEAEAFEFADGILKCGEIKEDMDLTQTVSLNEDGTLVYHLGLFDMSVYCTKVAD